MTSIILSATPIASSTSTRINAVGTKSGLPYSLLVPVSGLLPVLRAVTALTRERVAL